MGGAIRAASKSGEARFRLSGAAAFARVLDEGRRRNGRYVQIIVAAAAVADNGCLGMTVSRKALPRAVDRNRFKRKVRVAWRPLRPWLAGHDIIVRARPRLPRTAVDAAAEEAATLLAQVAGKAAPAP